MRVWIAAVVVMTACKGDAPKSPPVKLVAPAVNVASVLAADAPKPPALILLDERGDARLVASASWADLDAGRFKAARATPLEPLVRFLRHEPVDKASVATAKDWDDYSQTPLALEDPPPPEEDDDPPPPEEEDKPDDGSEESGGTGTAITLEEGTLGKKDPERAEGMYHMKPINEDPQLARQRAIEQARAAGILDDPTLAGTFSSAALPASYDLRDYPSRGAHTAGAVVDGPLNLSAMILVAPTAKAMQLIDAVRETQHAIAVSHAGKLRPLRIQFGLDNWQSTAEWLEVRVATNKLTVEAVPETPIEIAALSDLAAALAQARASRGLDSDAPVDVLVDPDVDAQRLVDVLVAVDKDGARVIGIGPVPTGQELALRGRRLPRVTMGYPNAQGDLDKRVIRRTVRQNISKIRACYESALRTTVSLKGTVSVQFFIAPDGTVAVSNAAGVSLGLADCVAAAIKSLQFPKPKGGGGVQVNYPFTFQP